MKIMKILKFLSTRMFITCLLILIQLAWMFFVWFKLSEFTQTISVLFTIISLLIALYIIRKDANPSFKIGWIILIMALPLFGGLTYYLFGGKRPQKRMRQKITRSHEHIKKYIPKNEDVHRRVAELDRRFSGIARYMQERVDFPIWDNSDTKYYPIGEEMFEDMLDAMKSARRFIFMEYFIFDEGYMWDSIHEILRKKVKEGVEVRIIYDDFGCLDKVPANFYSTLEKEGIKCLSFNPFIPIVAIAMSNRDHRKILVVDGEVAFTGGINIADEYINRKQRFGHWKDTGIRIKGDAAWSFTATFLEMWNAFRKTDEDISIYRSPSSANTDASGFVLPFADSPLDNEPVSQNIYVDILSRAKDYVYIFTPYLIIDYEMQSALEYASKRGVDIRIITPGIPDKKIVNRMTRSYYYTLLKNGVRIFEYTPGFIHAKSFVCDDITAVVGTVNMDYRSLYHHFECATLLYDTDSIQDIKKDYLETETLCREIKRSDLKQGFFWALFDAVMRVFSPLM